MPAPLSNPLGRRRPRGLDSAAVRGLIRWFFCTVSKSMVKIPMQVQWSNAAGCQLQ